MYMLFSWCAGSRGKDVATTPVSFNPDSEKWMISWNRISPVKLTIDNISLLLLSYTVLFLRVEFSYLILERTFPYAVVIIILLKCTT